MPWQCNASQWRLKCVLLRVLAERSFCVNDGVNDGVLKSVGVVRVSLQVARGEWQRSG